MEIIEITEEEAQERMEELVDSCETGQVYIIKRPDGSRVMMVPADPSFLGDYDYLRNHDDAC